MALALAGSAVLAGCGSDTKATTDDKANIERLAKEGIGAPKGGGPGGSGTPPPQAGGAATQGTGINPAVPAGQKTPNDVGP